MSNKTITIQIGGSDPAFRKFDIVKTYSDGRTAIVIQTKSGNGLSTMKLYPYKVSKYRLVRWVKFQWLKIRLLLKIIK